MAPWGSVVFKIVPMEGAMLVNEERQKGAADLLAEVEIALALSALRGALGACSRSVSPENAQEGNQLLPAHRVKGIARSACWAGSWTLQKRFKGHVRLTPACTISDCQITIPAKSRLDLSTARARAVPVHKSRCSAEPFVNMNG